MSEPMVTVLPIVGYSIATHPSGTGVMIIRHLPGLPPANATRAQIDAATLTMQYGLTPDMCADLAKALTTLAEKLRQAKKSLN